jgi:ubiquinone/menaquinone biosynthesis C-methylase UbiE
MDGIDDRVDVTDMCTYADNQFDFFICSHVLEHVMDDRKALGELYRVLKPMGQGILMVPIVLGIEEIDEDPSITDDAERWRRFGQHDHVRLYSKHGFIDRVSEAGFRIHQHGWEYFGKEVFTRNGVASQSILYVVEK